MAKGTNLQTALDAITGEAEPSGHPCSCGCSGEALRDIADARACIAAALEYERVPRQRAQTWLTQLAKLEQLAAFGDTQLARAELEKLLPAIRAVAPPVHTRQRSLFDAAAGVPSNQRRDAVAPFALVYSPAGARGRQGGLF